MNIYIYIYIYFFTYIYIYMFPSWQTDVLEASGRFPESSRKLPEASGSFSGRRQLGASQRSLGGMRGIQDTPCGKSSGRGRGCQTIYFSEGCTTGFVPVLYIFTGLERTVRQKLAWPSA